MKDIDKYLSSIAENSNTYDFIKREIEGYSFISMITGEEKQSKKCDKNEKKTC